MRVLTVLVMSLAMLFAGGSTTVTPDQYGPVGCAVHLGQHLEHVGSCTGLQIMLQSLLGNTEELGGPVDSLM